MSHDDTKRDRPLILRPLSADHPFNDPTPTRVHAVTEAMLALMQRMCEIARHASQQPDTSSPSGWYHVGVLVNAEGMMMCNEDGVPIVLPSPQYVAGIDPDTRSVVFVQLKKRSEAAEFAGVSVSTLKRAEANGELRAEKVGDRDTSYWIADLNAWMLKRTLGDMGSVHGTNSTQPFRRAKKAKG